MTKIKEYRNKVMSKTVKEFLDEWKDVSSIRFLPYEPPDYYHYTDKAWVDNMIHAPLKECPICENERTQISTYKARRNLDDIFRAYGIRNKTIIAKAPEIAAITETGREVLNKTLDKLYSNGLISKDMLMSSMGLTNKTLDVNLDAMQEDLFSAPEAMPMTIEQELVESRQHYYTDNQIHANNACFGLFQQSFSLDKATGKPAYLGEDPLESMLLPPTPVAVKAWRKLVGR